MRLEDNEKKWADELTQFEERAKKLLRRRDEELEKLRTDLKKQEEVAKSYEGLLEKQRQQLMASLYK